MSQWSTTREQWIAWIEEGRVLADPVEVLDAWDGQFRSVLQALPFGARTAAATASPAVEPVVSYESMPTMVRAGNAAETDDDVDAAQTLVHGMRPDVDVRSPLEIGLRSPEGALQVDLDPIPATSGEWFIPPLTDRTTIAPAPAPSPTHGTNGADRTMPAPGPAVMSSDGGATSLGPPPPFDEPASPATARETAAIRTGTTLVPIEAVESASSRTAGEIVTVADDEPEGPPPPRRSSKIVIAPTPSAVTVETDVEPDVLESSDLLEEPIPPRPPSARVAAPPPPRDPPRAPEAARPPEPVRQPEPPRPASDAPGSYITGQTLPPAGPRHWSESVFAAHFAALSRPGAEKIADAEVAFIAEITGLAATATVVDVGCGEGRHASAFSERGHRTIGVDASEAQIHLAAEAFGSSMPKLRWVCQDVRDRGLGEQFDAVVCLGTTIGIYDDAQNRAVLEALRDLCTPNGRIVLHVVNRDYVVPRLPARTWWQGQGCLVLDEVDVHDPTSRINVKRTIVFEDGRQFEHVYDVRVYAVHELVAAVEAVGLRVVEVSGSRHTRGRFFGATSPDIWLVARR